MTKKRVLIIGAAGRDFHNFNTCFRDNNLYEVVAFTAAQIPDIDGRKYPAVLAGGTPSGRRRCGGAIRPDAPRGDALRRHPPRARADDQDSPPARGPAAARRGHAGP